MMPVPFYAIKGMAPDRLLDGRSVNRKAVELHGHTMKPGSCGTKQPYVQDEDSHYSPQSPGWPTVSARTSAKRSRKSNMLQLLFRFYICEVKKPLSVKSSRSAATKKPCAFLVSTQQRI